MPLPLPPPRPTHEAGHLVWRWEKALGNDPPENISGSSAVGCVLVFPEEVSSSEVHFSEYFILQLPRKLLNCSNLL